MDVLKESKIFLQRASISTHPRCSLDIALVIFWIYFNDVHINIKNCDATGIREDLLRETIDEIERIKLKKKNMKNS